MSNKVLGRKGTLVSRKYGRFQFDNLKEAQDYIATIRNDKHELKQPKEKYRGLEEHCRMSGTYLTNPLRSSLWVELCAVKERFQEKLVEMFDVEMSVLQGLGGLVVPKIKLDKNTKKSPPTKAPKP